MNIVINNKYRIMTSGGGYAVLEITGESLETGKEITRNRGYYLSLAGCVKRIFELRHSGKEIDSLAALVDQIESTARDFQDMLEKQVVTLRQEVREISEFD